MSRRPLNLAGKKNRFRTLTIENLEVRQLLSANAGSIGSGAGGDLEPRLCQHQSCTTRTRTS